MGTKDSLSVHVLFRVSAKTGKVDTTITGLGCGLLKMWALNNTTKTKQTFVFNRDNGELVYAFDGKTGKVATKTTGKDMGTCEDYGIGLEFLQSIKDERFDD